MDFRLTKDEETFLREVQVFLDENLPKDWMGVDPDGHNEQSNDKLHQFEVGMRRKLATKGWLGLHWPKKYGGQEAPQMKRLMLEQELIYRGAPYWGISASLMTGDMILQFGTEEQRQRFVPSIARGEMQWAVGMSEPNAGSDLANMQLRATQDGDYYVLNGQKTWQTGAHYADWAIVYTRTDPSAKTKQKGITTFLVDMKTPGIALRRISQMTGHPAFCEVFYDNVRIHKSSMLGPLNGGWSVALFGVATEKSFGFWLINSGRRDLQMLVKYCQETLDGDGRPVGKDPLIRSRLAQLAIELEVGRNLGLRLQWMATRGVSIVAPACQLRPFGGGALQRLGNLGVQILGLYGQLDEESKWVRLRGRMKYLYLAGVAMTIEGGTNEASRNTVATVGLGLPRV
ncbi:MAG: acyl-CoA dehydrogenase family protein [Chloroflexi bacterium]|nr:acyl-CoA dehydrogenase family protein [Chloroflexota bacterium]